MEVFGGNKLYINILMILSLIAVVIARCDRTPEGNHYPMTKAGNRFHIDISGNPKTYEPNKQYTVYVRGRNNAIEQHKFKEFLLVIEPEQDGIGHKEFQSSATQSSVGHFGLLGDALTIFSPLCPNAVSQTNSYPKTEIQVFWTAPPTGSGCVAFRATVVEQRDLWYMDEGDLTRILCEEVSESDDTQPSVLGKCCACDEAKYEVTFEGLWSRNTHPKDFPANGWLTRFSDVIGASHTKNYTFWNYGEYASRGLKQVAENGNTRELESELKSKSDHIRTIIKARGISYPNVTGKTFAVFRVDNQHHLMSLVSMIDPSPDWFVGVSSLELCLQNCTWVESKVLNLYPWDAGTDDGWTYISPDQPSNPPSPIRRIKANSPNDPRSPFYDSSGNEMKPLARLYLSRQRLYEKPCDTTDSEDLDQTQEDCQMTEWSDWSPCSATCGRGVKYRQRKYVRDSSRFVCKEAQTSRGNCWSMQRICPDHSEDRFTDPKCALTDWSEWSSCSVTCGWGSKTRDRRYMNKNATKYCTVGLLDPPKLKDTDHCFGRYGNCDGEEESDAMNKQLQDCPTRPWSEWSSCSATCGNGYKIRSRDPINPDLKYEDSNENSANDEDDEDPCDDETFHEIVACQAEIPTCEITSASAEEELIANRTHPKKQTATSILSFNLQMQDDANIKYATIDPINEYKIGGFIVKEHLNEDTEQHNTLSPVVACRTSHWSKWSPCNTTQPCGKGLKQKHREIITHAENGGKACPKKLIKFKKCRIPCDTNREEKNHDLNAMWGTPLLTNDALNVDCVMSKWSAWSPCNRPCGPTSVRQRTRQVITAPRGNGKPCSTRVETKACSDLVSCPIDNLQITKFNHK